MGQEEELAALEAKAERQRQMTAELVAANADAARRKQLRKKKDKVIDRAVLRYQRQKAAAERAAEEAEIARRLAMEKETARLRALQERATDEKVSQGAGERGRGEGGESKRRVVFSLFVVVVVVVVVVVGVGGARCSHTPRGMYLEQAAEDALRAKQHREQVILKERRQAAERAEARRRGQEEVNRVVALQRVRYIVVGAVV